MSRLAEGYKRQPAVSLSVADLRQPVMRRSGQGTRKCKYRPTSKNRKTLKRWKRGESVGFTATASLKAKGMIPRTSRKNRGKKIISDKYC